jgi:hypothetical protein
MTQTAFNTVVHQKDQLNHKNKIFLQQIKIWKINKTPKLIYLYS